MSQNQLDQVSQRISELLKEIEQADVEHRDPLLSQLDEQIKARKACLSELLTTELAKDPNWLRLQLDISRALAAQAKAELSKQQQQLGGYRKGRKQVSVYQNIELGK